LKRDAETGMKKLNLLYVGMLPPHPGGSGISWSMLLNGFLLAGHDVRAIAPITPDDLEQGDVFANEHPGLRLQRYIVPHHFTGPNIPAPPEYIALEKREITRLLEKCIESERPDVLVIGRESFARHVPDIARRHGIPTLLGIRGNTTMALVQDRYEAGLRAEYLDQFKKADLMVSVAHHMATGLRDLGFENIEVIENTVDTGLFCPGPRDDRLLTRLGIETGQIVVAHVSNLKAAKRPLDIVDSAPVVVARNPGVIYLVVGRGVFLDRMRARCAELGVTDHFRFAGWVPYESMPRYLQLADIVVSASATEGLSRVYLESMACGKLLLCSDIDPAREVVEDRVNGMLFRLGDVDDLAGKTLLAAGDPSLRKRIGDAARQQAARFGLQRAVSAYEKLLWRLAHSRAA